MDALGRNNVVTVEMLIANPNDFEDLRKAAALEGFGNCASCGPNSPFVITGGCYTGTSTSGFEYMRAFIRGQRGKKRAMKKAVRASGACCVCCACPQCLKKVAGYSSGDIYQVECTNIDEDDGDDFFGFGDRGGNCDDGDGDADTRPALLGHLTARGDGKAARGKRKADALLASESESASASGTGPLDRIQTVGKKGGSGSGASSAGGGSGER